MMTEKLSAALRKLTISCEGVARQTNEPVPGLDDALAAVRQAAREPTPELGHDLFTARSILFKVHLSDEDGASNASAHIDALRHRLTEAIAAASEAGYAIREEQARTPDTLEIRRIDHAEQLERLEQTIASLATDIREIRDLQDKDDSGDERQQTLVQYFVERAEVKVALIEVNLKEAVELLGLGEAVAGLLRLTRDFVASVLPQTVKFAGWLKDKARRMKPAASAVTTVFAELAGAIRARSPLKPADADSPPMTQEEAEAMARQLILADKPVPEIVAQLVVRLDFSDEESLTSVALLSNLANLESLILSDTPVRDASPLASLTRLRMLSLSGTRVSDLSHLSALTELERLYLAGTLVSIDGRLISVRGVPMTLSGQHLTDISSLRYLTRLRYLDLGATQITDITPISRLTNLRWLSLWNSKVNDIRPLANLSSLNEIDLRGTRIDDIFPVYHVPLVHLSPDHPQYHLIQNRKRKPTP